ncbi:DUF771 domain-containing protein [Lactiplantibacillus paraxiangfangensis]|uniref:DUF771 domain-containing protein n=1 Tax=Lactiplantibacillus paraxiangfangensis TaxID=3076224 RepID=UPI0030C6F987
MATDVQTEIKANVTLELPDDKVIVDKTYFESLERFRDHNVLHGKRWTVNDLIRVTGHQRTWISQKIFSKYEKELSTEYGGPVYYPATNQEKYSIDAERMSDWLSIHFEDLYTNQAVG